MALVDNTNWSYQPSTTSPYLNSLRAPINPFIWVQGIAGANAYQLAPEKTVILWDSENPCIYIKSTDRMGFPTTKILKYTEEEPQKVDSIDTSQYATKNDLQELEKRITSLLNKEKQNG